MHCVIEITEDIAIRQARAADAEIAAGKYRGPLHGIPYGIKDLFAVAGTHTTWGTPPYKNQEINQTAFVAAQLEKAGAVLVAKLSLGELAMDDVWFGGLTRNPWDTTKGSGGSSAGSAVRNRCRSRSLCHRNRNLWFYRGSGHALRRHRTETYLWQYSPDRRHDAGLEFRQDRSSLQICGRRSHRVLLYARCR